MGLSEESFWKNSLSRTFDLINKHIEFHKEKEEEPVQISSMKEIAGW